MKRIILILMTLAIAGWTGAAKAQVLWPRDDDAIRRSAAPTIRAIANEMTDATADLYSMAAAEAQSFGDESVYYDDFGNRVVSRSDRLTFEESLALERLRDLNSAASRFERVLERRGDPNLARREYRRLVDAHHAASARIASLDASSAVYDRLRRVDRLMDELIDRMA